MENQVINSDETSVSGNTKIRIRSCNWCFTLNNYCKEDIEYLKTIFDDSEKYVFQEEIGEEGTRHLQGVVRYKNAKEFGTMKGLDNRIHWERCRDFKKSVIYCSKNESRSGRIFHKGLNIKNDLIDYMEGLDYYFWQEHIIRLYNRSPNHREILWIYDSEGGKGKSVFTRHLLLKGYDIAIIKGKSNDIYHYISKLDHIPKMFIFDTPRSCEEYLSYRAIEELKDGMIFSGKYDSCMKIFNIPHVVVFSNRLPEYGKLSDDRCNVMTI